MEINRVWSMPNKNTFTIKPILEIFNRYKPTNEDAIIIDPFANTSRLATITNDIDPQYNTDYNLDAIDFLKMFDDESIDMVIYDPPFSPRQVSECYKRIGRSVNMQTTQSRYWSEQKKEISRILKKGGAVISCGWNSSGIGKKYGFTTEEILLVAHGGNHNDTIVTVDRKG